MARSRLEKIGTIFDRVSGLLRTNAIKPEDKPLWYDIYQSFPPTYEPRYDRPAPNIPVRPILYNEDVIRAKFHKSYRSIGATNLANPKLPSATQRFLSIYEGVAAENSNSDEAFSTALNLFISQKGEQKRSVEPPREEDSVSAGVIREAKLSDSSKTAIKDIFKE